MSSVLAADYPSKTINMVVGYAPGGGTDVMARTIASYLEKYLDGSASVVVRNRPGAGGQIGFSEVASARADGYTLGTMNLPAALAVTYDRNADYDAESFTWLANFVADPNTLVVPVDSEFESLQDVIDAAGEGGSRLTVGLSALGGNDHFAATMFANASDIELNEVPFNGASLARSAIMGGHVDMGTMAYSQTVGFEDELRVLAVFADERIEQASDVPTVKELGFDVEMGSFRGIVAPSGLPDDVREVLMAALAQVAEDPEFLAVMERQGSPVQFAEGDAYEALAQSQDQIAQHIWETTPWK
ncbi:tripartite tricarboxylate transporter substrate binding protein [Halomonas dongshanensis]|uniref:Tripartite tricarboxylate transporter substrate binding protein n=1 Tax=Halomonas dongshanensis TaxID=2890835 RepID=A0ABT2EDV8_9GAMM|nr:tripartite tricarboxylate transporter substrate binding protein [Halomonas dongshanensis]MCS2609782.1 tripartite tricarboxylate transporter substrate binding protein [Halomonas dongshanensis]